MIASIIESIHDLEAVLIVAPLTLFLVIIIGRFWYKARQADIDASLKEEMLARGMSADEIQKVLEASSEKGSGKSRPE